jgi:hypothetical protein
MGMPTESATTEHLSPELANLFLEGLPEKIRSALESRAKAMNYPVWAIVEMAIAGYLVMRRYLLWIVVRGMIEGVHLRLLLSAGHSEDIPTLV